MGRLYGRTLCGPLEICQLQLFPSLRFVLTKMLTAPNFCLSPIGHGETIVSNVVHTSGIEIRKHQGADLTARVQGFDESFDFGIHGGIIEFCKNKMPGELAPQGASDDVGLPDRRRCRMTDWHPERHAGCAWYCLGGKPQGKAAGQSRGHQRRLAHHEDSTLLLCRAASQKERANPAGASGLHGQVPRLSDHQGFHRRDLGSRARGGLTAAGTPQR